MKHPYPLIAIAFVIACVLSAPASAMEFDGFLAEVNVAARADLGRFRADLSATFRVSSGEIDDLFDVFDDPADVYISLRIRDVAHVSLERVTAEYRKHKGRGWGVIAKNLGIQPGSAEFHALKQGRLTARADGRSSGKPGNSDKSGRGNQAKKGKSGK